MALVLPNKESPGGHYNAAALGCVLPAEQGRTQRASQTGEDEEGYEHHDQTQDHHQSKALRSLQVLEQLSRLGIGATGRGLLDGFQ